MAASDQFVEQTTSAALEEKAKLQKHFNRFDIYFFLICTIVGVDTLGQIATDGAQGFLWLIVLAVLFFIPYALLTAELGSAFTEEGGQYVWTRMSWGRGVAAMNAVFYWFSNPIWIGASLALLCIAAAQGYFYSFSNGSWAYYLVGLGFIWFSVYSAILSFGVGKWIPTLGAWCRILVLGLFVVTVVIYGFEHGLHFPAGHQFSPTWTLFIAIAPLVFFNYVGFELPNAAGDEMKDAQKDVPFTVLRAMITAILLYGLPILAIISVVPVGSIHGKGVSAFLDAVSTVFVVYGGAASIMVKLATAAFIIALISSACTWLMGSDRSQAVACYDGAGPRYLGSFSAKLGTPVRVNFLSGICSTIVFVVASLLTSGSAASAFNVMIDVVLAFTTLSYIVIFPTIVKLRKSHPDVHRPYKVPGGMTGVWICAILTTFWAVFASIVSVFPGFADGQLLNNADISSFGVSRLRFETISLASIGITLVVGLIFYWLGAETRADMVTQPIEGNEDLALAAGD